MKISKRHNARVLAMQAVYSWDYLQYEPKIILEDFLTNNLEKLKTVDVELFKKIFLGTTQNIATINASIEKCSDRQLSEINSIDLAILQIGFFELFFTPEIDLKIVINEAIEIAKKFSNEKSYKFINGALNKATMIATATSL